ncbi:MAG: hypothetical protein CSA83_01880 [Actinomycetales bacterium]|nr:MAG: hypothetical protein CSA83_01880 [Actinomycetales bacterium]
MIIRILGEGQFVVEQDDLVELGEVDNEVEAAAQSGDQERLTAGLARLIERVKEIGTVVPDDVLAESDLILPDASATVDEIVKLLDESSQYPGMIPTGEQP